MSKQFGQMKAKISDLGKAQGPTSVPGTTPDIIPDGGGGLGGGMSFGDEYGFEPTAVQMPGATPGINPGMPETGMTPGINPGEEDPKKKKVDWKKMLARGMQGFQAPDQQDAMSTLKQSEQSHQGRIY